MATKSYKLLIRQPCSQESADVTTEQILERERGKGHVTVTTVTCEVQQWDRYRVQRILVKVKFESRPVLMSKYI